MKNYFKISSLVALGSSLIPTLFVRAVNITNPAPGFLSSPEGDGSFGALLGKLINGILLPLAGIIAMLFIIIGGYQYMTSGGDEEAAARGKRNLQNAVIGLVIIILSYVIVTVVINALSGKV